MMEKISNDQADFNYSASSLLDCDARSRKAMASEGTSNSQKRLKRTRKVRFSQFTNLHPCLIDFEDLAVEKIWYNGREVHKISKEAKLVAREARKGLCDETVDSTRGLEEFLSMRASLEKRSRRVANLQAVLGEQDLLRAYGVSDPERICKQSKVSSRNSLTIARAHAKNDAIEAVANDYNNKSPMSLESFFTSSSINKVEDPLAVCSRSVFTKLTVDRALKRIVLE
jgi:hypothetical protein